MATLHGLRLDPAGNIATASLVGDDTLSELYRVLDCETVQILELEQEISLIIDEEGKLRHAAPNLTATAIALLLGYPLALEDVIVGPVAFFRRGSEDIDSLTETQRSLLLRIIAVAQA